MVHPPERRRLRIGQLDQRRAIRCVGGQCGLALPAALWGETVVGGDVVALPDALFLIAGDALDPLGGHGRHLEDAVGRQAGGGVEQGVTVRAAIRIVHAVALVDIAADMAELGGAEAHLDPAGRQDRAGNAVLAPLVVDQITRAELAQGQKARPGDKGAFLAAGG